MTKEPTKEELQAELRMIKAEQEQLKKQIVDLGRHAAICQRQILDLAPSAARIDARTMK